MKKFLSFMAIVLLAATSAFSQSPSPGIFNYQGVARNSVGNVLINRTITLRLTVHDGAAAGPTVYQESRTAITNPFGLFNVQVGSAGFITQVGTIAGVNWGVGNKYIQVEIDPNGGSSFINIGTAQIASVPYSLYSSLSNDLVLPFIKTQAATGSTLIGITNSATTGTQGAIWGTSASQDGNAYAISGTISSTSPGGFSSGVRGVNNGTGGLGIGVYGSQNGSGWGVYGTTPSGIGVNGTSTSGTGVNGSSTSGFGVFGTSSTSNAGRFSNSNAANPLSTVLISTTSTNATALSVSGPGIWGSAIGITNTTSGMEWRTSVNGTTYTITKVPGSTFSPFTLLSDGQVEFPSTAGANRLRILDNGNIGLSNAAPTYRLDVDATTGGFNGVRVRNTASFATVDVVGVGTDQAFRFGKSGSIYSGINTGSDGDHINFFKFGAGQNLMSLNVNTGNLGVGGPGINAVSKISANGFNVADNLYSSSTGFNGATGVGVNDVTAQATNEKWGIHTFVNGAVGTQHAIFAEPGTTAAINTGLFARVSTAPAGGQSFGLFAVDPVNNASTWAATIRGRLQYQDGTQGLNKILRSDAAGNASWVTLAGGGIVGGSGTLDFIPKWTPDGVTLGNSQIFDNGTNVGIANTTPAYRLDITHGGATGVHVKSTATFSVVDIDAANGDAALRFQRAGVNQWNIRNRPADDFLEIFELGGGGSRMVIANATGNVGIGATINPVYKLDVENLGANGIRSRSSSSFSVVDIDGFNGDAALRFIKNGVSQWNIRNRPADDFLEIFELGGGGSRMVVANATGNVGIGSTINPVYKLEVESGGNLGIRTKSTSSFTVVDIDAANGDAALRLAKNGVNQWNIRNRPADDFLEIFELGGGGSRMVIANSTGNVGIGSTINPVYKLEVESGGNLGIRTKSTSSFTVIDIDAANGDAALRLAKNGVNQWNIRNRPADDFLEIFELGGGGSRLVVANSTGNLGVGSTINPTYKVDVETGSLLGIRSKSNNSFVVIDNDAFNGDAALRFASNGTFRWNTRNDPLGGNDYQIFDMAAGLERMRIEGGTGNVEIAQNLNVVGTLSKGAGAFKIDHPLDPENKYLWHSFVESPDMMNIYNGNIVTDASGKATVQLPDYFEALNMEFRYQLTVIGAFAQAIINKEVSNNKFEIASNQPNVKVSWQVTGVRHDAYAQKNRIPNTVEKEAENKGKYLSPEAFNQPKAKGIGYTDLKNDAVSSLNYVAPVEKKAASATTGGSLDQMPVQKFTANPIDKTGSVEDIAPQKEVIKIIDNTGGSVMDTEPLKPSTKKLDNSGSVSEEMQKPVIKTQEPKVDKTIEPAKQVKETLPAVLKGTSMDPDAKPVMQQIEKTTPVVAPQQNSSNTAPQEAKQQATKTN